MKQLSRFSASLILCSLAIFLGGCASTGGMAGAGKEKERLLAQAGFQMRSLNKPKQQERLAQLPADRVSTVKYHGRIYYVYPLVATNRAYIGNKAQYQSYLQLLRNEQAQANAPKPVFTEEVPGPGADPILIQEYDDWNPLLGTQ